MQNLTYKRCSSGDIWSTPGEIYELSISDPFASYSRGEADLLKKLLEELSSQCKKSFWKQWVIFDSECVGPEMARLLLVELSTAK